MELKDLTQGEFAKRNVNDLILRVFDNKDGRLLLEYLETHKFVGNCDLMNSNRTYYEQGKRDAIRRIKQMFNKAVAQVNKETKEK